MRDFHTPVLLEESLAGLKVTPGGTYIDATVGGAGLTEAIVKRGGQVLGLDCDSRAIEFATQRLEKLTGSQGRWVLVHGNFRDIAQIAHRQGINQVNGVAFDLGVSSHQLDEVIRGFSFADPNAGLDMRMDEESPFTALDLLNSSSEEELYDIVSRFGEEKLARSIARAICQSRQSKPIQTSGQLRDMVALAVGQRVEVVPTLARVYQALRIAVNDELGALKQGLAGARDLIKPGGRLVVISFHSLEDRLVKLFMKSEGLIRVTKKPITPTRREISLNSRSRSGKLRIAERL